ncbi:MAG TPA: hypothetical protein VIT67_02730, partial [Povalibacter sp.]
MKSFAGALFLIAACPVFAQGLPFPETATTNAAVLSETIPALARKLLTEDSALKPSDRFVLQLAANQYPEAVATFAAVRQHQPAPASGSFDRSIPLELYAKAKAVETSNTVPFQEAFNRTFAEVFARFDDRTAFESSWFLGTPLTLFDDRLQQVLTSLKGQSSITVPQALDLM